jgi:outer membrane immunogenic protein
MTVVIRLHGDFTDMDDFDQTSANTTTFRTAFTALGGEGGYNWQWGSAVLGAEADIDWTNANVSRPIALNDGGTFPPVTAQFKMDRLASLRARAGLAVDDSLIYVTAGPAVGHFSENTSTPLSPSGAASFTVPWTGWTPGMAAGAGVGYMLDPHWSLRAEFLHFAFADKIINCVPLDPEAAVHDACATHFRMQYANSADVARIGLDYKFDPAPAAVRQ